MKLSQNQLTWIRRNEVMINSILKKRIEELKDQMLEVPEEKRNGIIIFINEYKAGLGLLKEKNKVKQKEDFTGV